MEISTNPEHNFINIDLPKSYDYSTVNEFYNIFREVDMTLERIDLNFAATNYADSSSLGMLLHIRDLFPDSQIRLFNCKPCIYRLFYIAKFADIFVLEDHLDIPQPLAA
ncbi:MAG: STAS domain-containing protein [Glaciecola sp.]|jgi:anti-anti-sigma regulatory factor|nr:STAS domain-containing protein [Glaciecola sp.]MDG1816776.1 STAS domain-containing protein [Glaciecola sp.]MDG2099625.1 STAS domain-containing protein [Glaciecola sp.]